MFCGLLLQKFKQTLASQEYGEEWIAELSNCGIYTTVLQPAKTLTLEQCCFAWESV